MANISDIILKSVRPPEDDNILMVDIFSDGKAKCSAWSEKWIDAIFVDKSKTTNADRIRMMSDEELAKFAAKMAFHDGCIDYPPSELKCDVLSCYDCWLEWLKEKVDDDNTRTTK